MGSKKSDILPADTDEQLERCLRILGEAFKKARREVQFTEIEQGTGCGRAMVSKFERGEHNITISNLIKLILWCDKRGRQSILEGFMKAFELDPKLTAEEKTSVTNRDSIESRLQTDLAATPMEIEQWRELGGILDPEVSEEERIKAIIRFRRTRKILTGN